MAIHRPSPATPFGARTQPLRRTISLPLVSRYHRRTGRTSGYETAPFFSFLGAVAALVFSLICSNKWVLIFEVLEKGKTTAIQQTFVETKHKFLWGNDGVLWRKR
ncbi:hypothetical protein E3N88_09148 [Mikania micrantha]|uniref:Transmembrane protein n=1 Tax=Mikania micrantha TaxID=192012 RepID=A0A5N6PIW5_9ASTR|nr:hypothetical protein E3N88_09148 [Mikania micrantha]